MDENHFLNPLDFLNQERHHAYILENVEGLDFSVLIADLFSGLEDKWGIKVQGNPDVSSATYERFGVDESRELIEKASLRSVTGKTRVFVFAASTITTEAQNSLLKLLEEPPAGTHFFIIIDNSSRLLPTFISRVRVVQYKVRGKNKVKDKKNNASEDEVLFDEDTFLKSSYAKRLDMVKVALKFLEKEKIQKSDVANFIKKCQKKIYSKNPLIEMSAEDRQAFALIDRLADYAHDRSSSAKLLLETLALFAPIIRE